jgi:hypothetical protein
LFRGIRTGEIGGPYVASDHQKDCSSQPYETT